MVTKVCKIVNIESDVRGRQSCDCPRVENNRCKIEMQVGSLSSTLQDYMQLGIDVGNDMNVWEFKLFKDERKAVSSSRR
jgi:hypothetical protein